MSRMIKRVEMPSEEDKDLTRIEYTANQGFALWEIETKLGKLEDLEEQLGCPLEVVFKALEQEEIFAKIKLKNDFVETKLICSLNHNGNGWFFEDYEREINDKFYLKDYKKTWWLKEDKSE